MAAQPEAVPAEEAKSRNSLFRLPMKTKILILTKFPEAGKVKSRLAKEIGNHKAAEIYRTVLLNNWQQAKETDHEISIEFSPPDSKDKFHKMFGSNAKLNPQVGSDIGWKMANAFTNCFQQQFDAAILIGGDAPNISTQLFNEALTSLQDHDIVLGPTHDGGYFLIGFKWDSFDTKYFQNINWSTPKVFEQTSDIIRKSNNKLYLIEKRIDLDTFHDVKEFLRSNKERSGVSGKILEILECEDSDEDNSFNTVTNHADPSICSDRDLR